MKTINQKHAHHDLYEMYLDNIQIVHISFYNFHPRYSII